MYYIKISRNFAFLTNIKSIHLWCVPLPPPLFEVFCMEVGVSARPVWAWALYRCLHLRLRWYLVIHLGWIYVCGQGQGRGVWLLPLIEGLEIPPDLFHVFPGGFGRPCGRMPIPTFHYGVHSTGVRPSCDRLQTRPDLCFCLICSPPGIRHQGTEDGSCDPPCQVSDVAGVLAQGLSFFNKQYGSW